MKFNVLALLGMLSISPSKGDDSSAFSTTGRFFYTQVYYQGDDLQQYYIKMKLGCNDFGQNWIISTLEESAGYVTSICKPNRLCTVPDRFPWQVTDDFEVEDPCVSLIDQLMTNEMAYLNDGTHSALNDPVPEYRLQGYSTKNRITFSYGDFNRQMQLNMRSFAIMQSNEHSFSSKHYSGYLGLQPYSAHEKTHDESLIYHLVTNEIIDHPIVSLYMPSSSASTPSLKFGSFDQFALYDINDFVELKTVDEKSWAVAADKLELNDIPVNLDKELAVIVEPQMSMIFIPADHYEAFIQLAKEVYQEEIDCSSTTLPCVFNKRCTDVSNKKLEFKLTVKDDQNSKLVKLDKDDLLMNGQPLGQPDKCFLGVFNYPITLSNQDRFYLGVPFLNAYYVSLSMEPYTTGQGNYLKVGLGPICPLLNLAALQYDPNYAVYEPAQGDLSEEGNSKVEQVISPRVDCPSWSQLGLNEHELALNEAQQTNQTLIIIIVVGVLIFLITLAVAFVYLMRLKKRKALEQQKSMGQSSLQSNLMVSINRGESVESEYLDKEGTPELEIAKEMAK